jgi:hypothetical protein
MVVRVRAEINSEPGRGFDGNCRPIRHTKQISKSGVAYAGGASQMCITYAPASPMRSRLFNTQHASRDDIRIGAIMAMLVPTPPGHRRKGHHFLPWETA